MSDLTFNLEILSPEKTLFKGEVNLVTFPGEKGSFTVMYNHAPLISTLIKGTIRWKIGQEEHSINQFKGFVQIKENRVVACVES